MAEVTLTIDGHTVKAEEGMTILEAARAAGIHIPTLCWDEDLEPYGGCRLCIVHVEGLRGLPPSCTTAVADGMVVTTENPEITETRRMVVRLLLADHPTDCHGLPATGREGTKDQSNAVFWRDMSKCVLCARCVKTCHEILGLGAIDLVGRGTQSEPAPFLAKDIRSSTCESCGECVVHCPTGALAFVDPPPEPESEAATVCPYCGTGCGIILGARRGKVVSARGNRDNPVNKGVLCVKGRFGSFEYVSHEERLTAPMIRKDGELVEATWDEALDLVARKLESIEPSEFGAFTSAKVANEDNYLLQKFTRAVMKTNSIDHCARL
jgi:predicted molibdopterin-dependent oxidoreductase YjgC